MICDANHVMDSCVVHACVDVESASEKFKWRLNQSMDVKCKW